MGDDISMISPLGTWIYNALHPMSDVRVWLPMGHGFMGEFK